MAGVDKITTLFTAEKQRQSTRGKAKAKGTGKADTLVEATGAKRGRSLKETLFYPQGSIP
jgi:hypothetical protein